MAKKSTDGSPLLSRFLRWYLAAMVLLFPLLPALAGYQNISRWAVTLFWAASGLLLAAIVVLPVELAITGSGSLRRLWGPLSRRSPVTSLLLLYLLWTALSALLSPYPGVLLGQSRGEGLLTMAFYVMTFAAVSAYGRWEERLADLLGIVMLVNAALGLLQYAGYNPLGLFPDGTGYHDAFLLYNGAFLGTLGNIDILSAFLCLVTPLFYGSFIVTGRRRRLPPLASGIFLLALADVDSGLVGICAMLLLTLPLFFSRRDWRCRGLTALGVLLFSVGVGRLLFASPEHSLTLRPGRLSLFLLAAGSLLMIAGRLLSRRLSAEAVCPFSRRCAIVLTVAVFLLLLGGIAAVWLLPFSEGPLGELHQILLGNFDPAFGSGRLRIWQETLPLITEHPFFGGGPDTLGSRMPFTFDRYVESAGQVIHVVADTAHNDFLNIAVNQGLPALGLYLAALAVWFYRAAKRSTVSPVLAMLLPGLLAFLVQSCFTFSVCSVSALFWIFLGLGEAELYRLCRERQKFPLS